MEFEIQTVPRVDSHNTTTSAIPNADAPDARPVPNSEVDSVLAALLPKANPDDTVDVLGALARELNSEREPAAEPEATAEPYEAISEPLQDHDHRVNEATEDSPELSFTTISVLELAEILDQHRIWVESAGDAGNKADLCGVNLAKADLTGVNLQGAQLQRANLSGADLSMANLRGANLVQSDMRDTNLLGAELRGANLMGANLYGAEGVWVGRLGGANLFDAILPETVAAFDSSKAIEDATKVARWFYFLMLGISAASCLLIAATSDVHLILNSSAIPHTGNFLPMTGFYLGGSLLLFVAYVRFHFLLLRLWGSMAELPAVFVDGQTLEKDGPWYLMGVVRRHFKWNRDSRSPFAMLESLLSTFLAYWVVPTTLFLFWLRYLVRQDFRGTLLHTVLLTLSVGAATCLPSIRFSISAPRRTPPPEIKKHFASRVPHSSCRARNRRRCSSPIVGHQPRPARRPRRLPRSFQRQHSPLGRPNFSKRRLSALRRPHGSFALHSSREWRLERSGRRRDRWRSPQPDRSSFRACLSFVPGQRKTLARQSRRRIPLRS